MSADILTRLDQMRDEDRKKFLIVRASMRRAYLMSLQATVGIAKYQMEDDTFMDAMDAKIEMLMTRAGIETPLNANEQPQQNATDPFAHITRPSDLRMLEQEISKQVESLAKKDPPANGWGSEGEQSK